jgi:hypothetical protein
LNKKLPSITLTLLTLLMILPSLPAHALGGVPTVAVSPGFNARVVGETFAVSLAVSDVPHLLAYDVTLNYNNLALSAQSVDFTSRTVFSSFCATTPPKCLSAFIPSPGIISDDTGTVRAAYTLLGGAEVSVTAEQPLMIITFKVIGAFDSALTISDATLAVVCGTSACALTPQILSGSFLVPPSMSFVAPNGSCLDCGDNVGHLQGNIDTHLASTVRLSPTAARGGYAFVRFTVIDPNRVRHTVDSSIVFLFPSNSTTVTVPLSYEPVTGTYQVLVTMFACPVPTVCIQRQTAPGVFFRIVSTPN